MLKLGTIYPSLSYSSWQEVKSYLVPNLEVLKLFCSKKMGRLRKKLRFKKSSVVLIAIVLIILTSIIPLKIAIALHQEPQPQGILVLGGGGWERMSFAASFSRSHPNLEIWISGYRSRTPLMQRIFQKFGIPDSQVHYDSCATDTVTNFTCTVGQFLKQDLHHLYLVTSDYHMRRARAIATLVLGSRGIVVTPVTAPSKVRRSESIFRVIRDSIRSLLWIVTGKTGASLNPHLPILEKETNK